MLYTDRWSIRGDLLWEIGYTIIEAEKSHYLMSASGDPGELVVPFSPSLRSGEGGSDGVNPGPMVREDKTSQLRQKENFSLFSPLVLSRSWRDEMGATCTRLGSFLSPVPTLCFPPVLSEDNHRLAQGLRPSCFLKDLVLGIIPFFFFMTCYSTCYLTKKVSSLDPHFPRSSASFLLLVFDTINHNTDFVSKYLYSVSLVPLSSFTLSSSLGSHPQNFIETACQVPGHPPLLSVYGCCRPLLAVQWQWWQQGTSVPASPWLHWGPLPTGCSIVVLFVRSSSSPPNQWVACTD